MAKQAEEATLDDVPSLVEVAFSAFNSPYSLDVFPDSPGGREYMRQYYEMSIKSEPGRQQSKVFVVRDDDEGKVISAALYYVIRPGDGGLWPWRKRVPNLQPGMTESKMDGFFNLMMEQHWDVMKDEPRIYLEMVGTHEAHRKQGCATALLNRGNQLADEMDYPCYLNAAPTGKHLYEEAGYVADLEAKKARPWPMVRKKRSDRI